VTLWQRAPRAVYSVCGEDEYLSEDGLHVAGDELGARHLVDEPSTPYLAQAPSRSSSSGRLVGLGLLVGVIVSAVVLVVLNRAHRPVGPSRVAVVQAGSAHTTARVFADSAAGHGSVVGISNRAAPRARGALGFLSAPPSAQRGSAQGPSAQRGSAQGPSAQRGSAQRGSAQRGSTQRGSTQRRSPARGSIGHDSTEPMRESAQTGPPSTSEAAWPGAQAPPTGGEFDFEAKRR
jgi:hypothetical protein